MKSAGDDRTEFILMFESTSYNLTCNTCLFEIALDAFS
jgi:hypothetical protein